MTPVHSVVVHDTAERLSALAPAEADLVEAGKIAVLTTEIGTELRVDVELATPAEK